MNRIDAKFRALRRSRQKAFIAFITAGYPNLEITRRLILGFSGIGVDIIELGVPFSDPMADGPIIQEASQFALRHKVNIEKILSLVNAVRKKTSTPICLMTYYNPVFCFGEERFVKESVRCGVDGVIIPDLPPEEGASFMRLCRRSGLDTVCFISPTTSDKRMEFISRVSRGFIYYVSLTGVTGTRRGLSSGLIAKVKKIKKYTLKPVCVGFGISRPGQVREVLEAADGVIVGSAIVNKIRENLSSSNLVRSVTGFVEGLKRCIRRLN